MGSVTEFHGAAGLVERLLEKTEAMLENARNLRDALIHRQTDRIWEILAAKEEKTSELYEATSLWARVFGDQEFPADSPVALNRNKVRGKVMELRRLEHGNAMLSQSFLGAIKKAMAMTGTGIAPKRKVYGRCGRMQAKTSSLLVNVAG